MQRIAIHISHEQIFVFTGVHELLIGKPVKAGNRLWREASVLLHHGGGKIDLFLICLRKCRLHEKQKGKNKGDCAHRMFLKRTNIITSIRLSPERAQLLSKDHHSMITRKWISSSVRTYLIWNAVCQTAFTRCAGMIASLFQSFWRSGLNYPWAMPKAE